MRQELHQRLRCPKCQGRLGLQVETGTNDNVVTGWLDCLACVEKYAIVSGIPRFVPCETYADSFGLVWEAFRQAVLDSTLGLTHNHDRFYSQTGWDVGELRGKWVLELGCGAGRFTEIIVQAGATVVAVDYSTAVDVCRRNLAEQPRLHYVQGDIYGLPFRPGMFDYVCCFGVLHRLPDVRSAMHQLGQQVKPGGKLAVDIAPPRWIRRFGPTAWLRLLTRRMSRERAIRFSMTLTNLLLPLQRALGAIPGIGRRMERLLPIAPIDTLGLCSPAVQKERAQLAMCDRLTATHHNPGRVAKLAEWLIEAGIAEPQVFQTNVIVGRGVKPSAATSGQPRAA
jgi:SAM-dependent methyltransferase